VENCDWGEVDGELFLDGDLEEKYSADFQRDI
jgi:hypothetical protein